MGGDGILLLLLGVLSLRNGGGTGLLGSLCILYVFRLRFDMDFGGFRATERASCAIALLGLQ